jgi:hypothetical protein
MIQRQRHKNLNNPVRRSTGWGAMICIAIHDHAAGLRGGTNKVEPNTVFSLPDVNIDLPMMENEHRYV